MKIISKIHIKCIFIFKILIILKVASYSATDVTLDKIIGSKAKDFSTEELKINDVKIEVTDDGMKFSSIEISQLTSKISEFLEKGEPKIHYGMLGNCNFEIEDSKDNSPILITLTHPVSSKQYYLEFHFSPSAPNSVLPRADIVSKFSTKCNPVRSLIKETLTQLNQNIKKATEASKSKEQSQTNTSQGSSGSSNQSDSAEKERLQKLLSDLNTKIGEFKSKLEEVKSKSSKAQSDKLNASSGTQKLTAEQEKIKKRIAEIQKEVESLKTKKSEIEGRKPKTDENNSKTDKDAEKAANLKRIEAAKTQSQVDEASSKVVDSSQEAQRLRSKVSHAEALKKSTEQDLNKIKGSNKENELDKSHSNTQITTEECEGLKSKLLNTSTKLEKDQKEYVALIKAKNELLIDKNCIKYQKKVKYSEVSLKAKKIFEDLDKCFTFRDGFIAEGIRSVTNGMVKDSFNILMSIKPNKGNYDLSENIYTAKFSGKNQLCGNVTAELRKLRKKDNRKKREQEKYLLEKKLRDEGKTSYNGLLYDSREGNRLDRTLDYQPYDTAE